ncbi:uncharacterized protein LOC129601327 [Paramacrobiotus metropolitanus]|uniref:uncharacterized protein LOC129601327 n=1 Tax=Paramacrobiotus metropolitanus TaxID=2943436 RepID=UPI0024459326|nr:uncharacterized protein LOC129601327 [Paramacrobiotus metropolitanus]
MERFVAHGKTAFPLALGILMFAGFVAAAPTPSKEQLALFCNLESSAPAAEQMQALWDCIAAIGTNFHRLADAIGHTASTENSTTDSTLSLSSPTAPSTITTEPTVRSTPPSTPAQRPAPVHRPHDVTPSPAPTQRQREKSYLRRFVEGVGRMAEQHPFFTMVTAVIVLVATTLGGMVALLIPLFNAMEKRSLRGRIVLILMAILGVLFVAWALDNIFQALYY